MALESLRLTLHLSAQDLAWSRFFSPAFHFHFVVFSTELFKKWLELCKSHASLETSIRLSCSTCGTELKPMLPGSSSLFMVIKYDYSFELQPQLLVLFCQCRPCARFWSECNICDYEANWRRYSIGIGRVGGYFGRYRNYNSSKLYKSV